jgi:hypothetical protein
VLFFAQHCLRPLHATEARADRDALTSRIRQFATAQNAQILSLEQLPANPTDTTAVAMPPR